jgi:hypothetical protein
MDITSSMEAPHSGKDGNYTSETVSISGAPVQDNVYV